MMIMLQTSMIFWFWTLFVSMTGRHAEARRSRKAGRYKQAYFCLPSHFIVNCSTIHDIYSICSMYVIIHNNNNNNSSILTSQVRKEEALCRNKLMFSYSSEVLYYYYQKKTSKEEDILIGENDPHPFYTNITLTASKVGKNVITI